MYIPVSLTMITEVSGNTDIFMFSSEAKYLIFHFQHALKLLLDRRTNWILHKKRTRDEKDGLMLLIWNAELFFFNISMMVTVHFLDVNCLSLPMIHGTASVFEIY